MVHTLLKLDNFAILAGKLTGLTSVCCLIAVFNYLTITRANITEHCPVSSACVLAW